MKINFPLIAFIVLLLWSIGATYFGYQFYKKFTRVEENQTILLQQVDGMLKEKQLVLTPKEFKQAMDSTTKALMKEIGTNTRHIEQLVKASSTTKGTITFIPRDTIISRHDTLANATVFNHTEKFLTMRGIVLKDSASITWSSWDKFNILLYWKREGKFIPRLFGKKVYTSTIKGENPYMNYTINQNIKVQKR